MPANLCLRRRRLYDAQLVAAKNFFADLAKKYPRMATAITDPKLIGALEEILNVYVMYGITRDLNLLRLSNVLFIGDENARPTIDEALRAAKGSYTADPAVKSADAYDRYFAWYIAAANVSLPGKPAQSGVDAFYARYPLVDHAVRLVTDHHQKNIEQACTRVDNNWDDINGAFFPGRTMTGLAAIRTTGNDFHKGGKQVLILTFSFASGNPGRVVYKPSGVEIDCRIVGDSSIFKDNAETGATAVNPEGYSQENSLTELINKANPKRERPGGFTSQLLPTYRILPYQRSSIPSSYGYIEYLTHEPRKGMDETSDSAETIRTTLGGKIKDLDPAVVTSSDWIVDNDEAERVFFHQYGGLMAMAMAVSLCDLHVQNMIVHKKAPHLIDLEEALKKPMTRVQDTYLVGQPESPIGKYDDPTMVMKIQPGTDQTSDLQVEPGNDRKPADCVLYRYLGKDVPGKPAQAGHPKDLPGDPNSVANHKALLQGFVDGLEALASEECNAAVKAWVAGLERTIARFVPIGTARFAQQGRDLFWTYVDAAAPGEANEAYNDFSVVRLAKRRYFFRNAVSNRRDEWCKEKEPQLPDWGRDWIWPPYFAIEHPDHAWRDYLNCDVPSFYHFLGDADLLNSAQQPVNVTAARDWQNTYITNPGDLRDGWSPSATGKYFPESSVELVTRQLEWLRQQCAPPTGKREQLRWNRDGTKDSFLAGALEGPNMGWLKADFSRIQLGRAPAAESKGGGAQS